MNFFKKKYSYTEVFNRIFVLFSLLFFSLPNVTTVINEQQIILHVIYSVFLILFSMHNIKKIIFYLSSDKLLLIFISYFIISILWSSIPLDSSIYVMKILIATFFALYCVSQFDWKEMFDLIKYYLIFILIFTFTFTPLFPDIFIHTDVTHYGAWKSIFGHKNALGTICVIGVITSLVWFLSEHRFNKIKPLTMYALYLALTLLSTSRTAIIVIIAITTVIGILTFGLRLYRENKALGLSVSTFLVLISSSLMYFVYENLNYLLFLMGRKPNLTGRTHIWEVINLYIQEKFWTGYGAGGFWNSYYGYLATSDLNFAGLVSSHSGYYDLFLDLGLIGVFIFAFHYIKTLIDSINLNTNSNVKSHLFIIFYIIFIAFNNYSDSRLLNTTSLFWVLYCIVTYYIKKEKLSDNYKQL